MSPDVARSLRALGLDVAPAVRPLSYPGRPVTAPALLAGAELLPLRPGPGGPGQWATDGGGLDAVLAALGGAPVAGRRAVLATGSNASPAQLAHKLTRAGLPALVPMVPVRVRGLAVGCSAHIGRHGYVATAPYPDPGASLSLVAGWFDPDQLAAVDATEFNYRRVGLPDGGPVTLPSGEPLPGGADVYVSRWGVLLDPADGLPRPGGGDQAALLTALLRGSARLRALLGPGPDDWVRRAAADEAVRAEGTRLLAAEGWVLPVYDPRPPES
ncbi:hypothetical protein GCM10010218_35400 [Streptomyces mashuensis]|uniref:Uncharacterized protein n=1 Tax=Streptomyces mashuensis TaxID=33904 RepID=A0A919B3V2_9ACTN|nr:hypothetical protein [Streptomyces mashuensis]GHF50774.1 hypothetical protein GCM10010218_35400 [Streptomyces mashuensis]